MMNWKLKARIQNAVALLPPSLSYAAYYALQRHVGSLRRINPMSRLGAGVSTWRRIVGQGRDPASGVFLEVGTGRVPLVPLAYWLMGAERTFSLDLNPYMKRELVVDSLRYIADHEPQVRDLFGPALREERFEKLLAFRARKNTSLPDFLGLCSIDYIAPGDAAQTKLPSGTIDFHTSYTVFEHIPRDVLLRILLEGNRITRDGALFVHRIDYGDHFSYSDGSITAINFLQFDDEEWDRYADNRYMYMNRLRHDDYLELFEAAGHRVLQADPDLNQRSLLALNSGEVQVSPRFKGKPPEILAMAGAWMVTEQTI